MMGDDPAETFRQEAVELLAQLEEALLDLDDDPEGKAPLAAALRAMHTLKGSGGSLGFEALADFVHQIESAFDRLARMTRPPAGLIALALSAKDHMRLLIEDPAAAAMAGDVLLGRLAELIPGDHPPPAGEPPGAAPAMTIYRIRFRLPPGALVCGTNPLLLLDQLRRLGACEVMALTDAVPPLEDLDPLVCHMAWEVILTTGAPRTAIDEVFLFILDDMDLSVEALPGPARADQGKPGEPLSGSGEIPAGQPLEQGHPPHLEGATTVDSVRVPAERLDDLMDRVGELVIAQARLRQLVVTAFNPQLATLAEEIGRLADELRDTAMGIRTVPIGSLFIRYRRLVHDLAKDLGKAIALVTEGEEVELDRTVIERLNGPLVHLIRNCVDHGIEPMADRVAAGKPPQGRISLSGVHSGAEVLVRVTDDGRGLDRRRIRAVAESQGLLAAGAVPTDSEIYQLIFRLGFSTADRVTSVSGRGVGLDVVLRTVQALRGAIEVDSAEGRGTTVTLRLPLTLAIIDGLLVRVGAGRYVIPLSAVEECVELPAGEDSCPHGRNFLNIRGELVPFLRLREMFAAVPPADRYQKVVVVSTRDLRVGLVVDQVIGDHQTVIKSLSKLHADVESFSGATILGDGTVALILDIPHLVDFGQARDAAALQHTEAS